jgi:trimethylamine--corrinoid protein Co-methyltransferase
MLHAAGWLEGGLVSSPEKLILDADNLHMMQIMQGGPGVDENAQAMDALREVGPGSHFLGSAHTQRNFETAFYKSTYADSNSYEQWEAEGSRDTYQAPAIDPAIDEALRAYVSEKKGSQPDMNF